ncbi:MAG TPA: hypothetical protein VMG12_10050 [Polyangiaceae bacterium]|nr:hypothetical protein [Polyangiaceae bacterium]
MKLRLAARWLALSLAAAAPSAAQTAPGAARDLPAAESLYEAGKQLILDGRCELAVERLQASQSLDPAVGTLLLIGHCQEQLGKTASAWAAFRSARSLAQSLRQADREQIADTRARALEPRLARIEIELPAAVDTVSWSIREDGRELPRALIGVALPVDPGPREIRVSAPGYEPFVTPVVIADAPAVTRVRIPPLTPRPRQPEPVALGALEPPAAPTPRDVPAPRASTSRVLQALAYTGVGLGAAGLGVAAGYGISARHRFDDAVGECPAGLCSPRGRRLRESGDRQATIATVSAVSGAVLMASGISLWIAMPTGDGSRDAAAVGVAPVGDAGFGLGMRGAF